VRHAATKRLFISTTHTLSCLDLVTDKVLWEKPYEGGCDRIRSPTMARHLPAIIREGFLECGWMPRTATGVKHLDTPNRPGRTIRSSMRPVPTLI